MTQKLTFLFILSFVAFGAYAQEGDPIDPEESTKSEVILEHEMDSANSSVLPDQNKAIPKNVTPLRTDIRFNTTLMPSGEDRASTLTEKEEPKKLSYNFLYYLFYKFRKVDNADE